jgi:1-acylglycerone phosphate reductase
MAPTTARDSRQTVLITGCSEGGIGDALCREFHARGARVFATARNLSKVSHLSALGIEVIALDVSSPRETIVSGAVAEVSRRTGGPLDILVNNAGGGYQIPLLDADLDEARRLFDVNVWGVLAVTQAFAPLLIESAIAGRAPRVVNIGSIVSRTNPPWQGIYNASKGALFCINDTLRLELKPMGIKVLHVVTGGVATKFYNNATGQVLPSSSAYAPVATTLEGNIAGHRAREAQTCTAEQYARKVVGNVLSSRPSTTTWVGGMAFLAHMGYRFGWDWFNDNFIGTMWSMRGLEKEMQTKMKEGKLDHKRTGAASSDAGESVERRNLD